MMFKKPEIKKALLTICSYKEHAEKILAQKTDGSQSDKSFIKEYANKLYSEELYEYLNDNRVDGIRAIEFEDVSKLGELGVLLGTMPQSKLKQFTSLTSERVCIVAREAVSSEEDESIKTYHTTYIAESGDVLTVNETSYGGLLTSRAFSKDVVPKMSLNFTAKEQED